MHQYTGSYANVDIKWSKPCPVRLLSIPENDDAIKFPTHDEVKASVEADFGVKDK